MSSTVKAARGPVKEIAVTVADIFLGSGVEN